MTAEPCGSAMSTYQLVTVPVPVSSAWNTTRLSSAMKGSGRPRVSVTGAVVGSAGRRPPGSPHAIVLGFQGAGGTRRCLPDAGSKAPKLLPVFDPRGS